jgi:hypothetical protein
MDAGSLLSDSGGMTTPPGSCTPKTCAELGATCGPQGDGCGGVIDGGCGTCTGGQTCGGGGPGTGSTCGGSGACVPKTCAEQGIGCGPAGDGCGNTINCYPDDAGACPSGQTCGGGGPFKCGTGTFPDGGGIVDGGACVPTTCAVGQCGPTNDGCGHELDCPGCGAGGICGYPTPFFCGYPPDGGADGGFCVAKTCASQGLTCGFAGDGCGNVINCWPDDASSCPPESICGLTTPGQCSTPIIGADGGVIDGGSVCTPTKTCAGLNCGFIDDGCGNVLNCWPNDASTVCPGSLNSCGGGGTPNVCGGSPLPTDGGSLCVPLTCAEQHISCGQAGDGCGHTLNCDPDGGTACPAGDTCQAVSGGAVECVPHTTVCMPTTCAAQHISCGSAGDGCGNLLNCYPGDAGACTGGGVCESVSGGAVECVPPAQTCTPTTCAALGYNCGFAGDNCGNLLNCNGVADAGCALPEFCGGAGPNQCGFGTDGGTSFTACASGHPTTITGIAYTATDPTMFDTPITPDPIAGAYVWVPSSGTLPGITPGISCETCANPPNALAFAITAADGSFTLPNVPVTGTGTVNVPIIVQVGRWARIQTFPVTACGTTALPTYTAGKDVQLRLPRTSSEGNLPWFAFDTGSVDALECVLLKMGVDSSMFAAPSTVITDMGAGAPVAGGTRVAMYTSPDTATAKKKGGGTTTTNQGGAFAPDNSYTGGDKLYTSPSTMQNFDAVLFPCVGAEVTANKSATDLQNVVNYANSGGRVFGTHYSYAWTFEDYQNAPTTTTPSAYGWGCTTTGTDAKGNETYNPCSTPGETVGEWHPEQTIANDVTANIDTSQTYGQTFGQWMVDLGAATLVSGAVGGAVGPGTNVQFDIDNARFDLDSVNSEAEQWAYTENDAGSPSVQQMTFETPVNAAAGGQCGRVVFSDFHVNNTKSTYGYQFPAECTDDTGTTTKAHLPALTSQERALEYMIFNLTSCVTTTSVVDTCVKKTCASYPTGTCGVQSDGCGGVTTNCGSCGTGETCGGGGTPGVCGTTCVKRTCAFYGSNVCGTQSDGCGGTIPCDNCTGTNTCGGGGVDNMCGACVPKTCAAYPNECGVQSDGCGGLTANCNPCNAPDTCGGSGTPGVCGVPDAGVCSPKTCSSYPAGTCGKQSDGCGGLTLDCNPCAAGTSCGGGGAPGVCGAPDAGACTPVTCSAYPGVCGQQSDGCGGLTADCNPCAAGTTCGGSGTPGACGANSCTPITCAAQSIQCGPAGNGCGATLDCGSCPAGQTCGGGGTPGVCGGCTPLTCSSTGVGCGVNGDGCGGALNCPCPTGETCGGGGQAGVCGTGCKSTTCSALNLACGYVSDGCGNLLDCGTCPSGETCVNGACTGNTGPK